MSFITDIYSELESEFEGQTQKDHLSAFYTLINYLELTDTESGLSEEDLQEKFFTRNEYKTVVTKLIDHDILQKSNEGKYHLNQEAKKLMTPIFEDLMALIYKPEKKVETKDPALNLLYNCRSQIFTS